MKIRSGRLGERGGFIRMFIGAKGLTRWSIVFFNGRLEMLFHIMKS